MLSVWQKLIACTAVLLGLATLVMAVDQLIEMGSYVRADVLRVEGDTVIFGTGCTVIAADTSTERADSIRLGMQNRIEQRPTTHDIFIEAFRSFNITVDRFMLSRFDGQFYYSELVLEGPGKVLKLDVRPSDGMAIAVRAKAPMYVNKTLLQETGRNIC